MRVSDSTAGDADQVLADLIEDLAKKLQAGESVDLAVYAAEYPDRAEEIKELAPTLRFLANLAGFQSEQEPAPAPASIEAPKTSTSRPALGVLGDYRIFRELGRGGMGVVYEAEQISLKRRVALKVLPFAAVLDPKQLQRFKKEARAAASLRHPNIVRVYSLECEGTIHFYAMDYVEGQSLAEVIEELRGHSGLIPKDDLPPHEQASVPPVSQLVRDLTSGGVAGGKRSDAPEAKAPCSMAEVERTEFSETDTKAETHAAISTEACIRSAGFFRSVAHLGIQAAEALEHAHQMGVVHRDIKPSNLMADARGHLWITDFGLAMTRTETNLTMTGDVLGTLRYMSPEQMEAKRGVLDHRTDIYSLGVTLYELLTLRPAFAGDDRQKLMRQIAEEEPHAPRQHNKAIPKDLETIVLKAMAKEPEGRYGTAQELADDLRRFQQDRPIQARRPSLVERSAKWLRRHRPIIWWWAAMFLVAVVASTVSTLLIGHVYEGEEGRGLIEKPPVGPRRFGPAEVANGSAAKSATPER